MGAESVHRRSRRRDSGRGERAIAAIERDIEAHDQLRTFLDALGLKPQQVVEMLPRVTRCAAEMTKLANELGCDTSEVRCRIIGKDEEIESLRELAVL
ncbi:hypothetical protein Aduo_015594 [Ancylostoma duodenale]